MNWNCLFGKHEWKDNRLPFTHKKLRKCSRCGKIEVWILYDGERWAPFEGAVAIVELTFALAEMKKQIVGVDDK